MIKVSSWASLQLDLESGTICRQTSYSQSSLYSRWRLGQQWQHSVKLFKLLLENTLTYLLTHG